MKLAQGEYVALEKIENLYSSNPVVAQIFVHGDSLQSYLLAVIIPDPVQLAVAASKILGKPTTAGDLRGLAEACKDERLSRHVLETLNNEAKRHGLKGYVPATSPLFMIFDRVVVGLR
jgi:long-chain acyl-CoA synthetase